MIATILQLVGITVANMGGYLYDPAIGMVVSGVSVVYVGLALELAGR